MHVKFNHFKDIFSIHIGVENEWTRGSEDVMYRFGAYSYVIDLRGYCAMSEAFEEFRLYVPPTLTSRPFF